MIVRHLLHRMLARVRDRAIPLCPGPYALHLVLLAHRNSSASLLKQAFVVALPLALLLCAAALLRGASRTRRPRLAPLEVS